MVVVDLVSGLVSVGVGPLASGGFGFGGVDRRLHGDQRANPLSFLGGALLSGLNLNG